MTCGHGYAPSSSPHMDNTHDYERPHWTLILPDHPGRLTADEVACLVEAIKALSGAEQEDAPAELPVRGRSSARKRHEVERDLKH